MLLLRPAAPACALLLAALLLATTATHAFIPSPTSQPSTAAARAPTAMSTVPLPSANAPVPDQGAAGRSSIFPPPLMSFYGEQRRRLQEQEAEAQMQWATEFNNLLVTQGQELCVLGYEGFLRTGSKGAVACYHDDDGTPLSEARLEFTTLEELLSDERMDDTIREQLTERVTSYDPEKEVAVLFAYKGQVGLNVIRPTYSPRYIFEIARGKK